MAIIIISLSAFILFKPQIQGLLPAQPTATSIPAFSLTLSTSTPTVDIPIHQQSTQFEVTLAQNGAKALQFPCSVAIYSPSPYNILGTTRNLIDYQVINSYGNYQYSIVSSVARIAGFKGHI